MDFTLLLFHRACLMSFTRAWAAPSLLCCHLHVSNTSSFTSSTHFSFLLHLQFLWVQFPLSIIHSCKTHRGYHWEIKRRYRCTPVVCAWTEWLTHANNHWQSWKKEHDLSLIIAHICYPEQWFVDGSEACTAQLQLICAGSCNLNLSLGAGVTHRNHTGSAYQNRAKWAPALFHSSPCIKITELNQAKDFKILLKRWSFRGRQKSSKSLTDRKVNPINKGIWK